MASRVLLRTWYTKPRLAQAETGNLLYVDGSWYTLPQKAYEEALLRLEQCRAAEETVHREPPPSHTAVRIRVYECPDHVAEALARLAKIYKPDITPCMFTLELLNDLSPEEVGNILSDIEEAPPPDTVARLARKCKEGASIACSWLLKHMMYACVNTRKSRNRVLRRLP